MGKQDTFQRHGWRTGRRARHSARDSHARDQETGGPATGAAARTHHPAGAHHSRGPIFYERSRHLLSELEDAESSLAQSAVNPRGRLRIDIHGTPANELLLPRIGEFHARYPHIELAIGSGDRLVDLVREGVDCVVRAGEPRDWSLVTRRLALVPQVTCASPAYLAAHGSPLTPSDLAQHIGVNFFSASRPDLFPYLFEVDGKLEEHTLKGWISVNSVNSADSYKICAEQGCG
ncbi:LysR substrate binding domain-containing protein [Pseudorhodoferax soli]|uniref:LysR substrate binding domain-containing protein n=1 Tax=Pseudorhodoferax soli TaxID=545864 RepID=A0A368Y5L7_9BURK|nr:LysR substrate-binding domain-containing protein [Pseudorhodoferax soli]RCW75561.1 LysR substrate binding domain-containing protein [Pseudorhodoferax soli]